MQAAILATLHDPLVVDEVELPTELAPGQALVQVHYSGICGSQLGEIDGVKGPDLHLPHLLGHEGSGTVIMVGAGVRHVSPGDRVVMHWRPGAGIQSDPPRYAWQGRVLNAGLVTTFNSYAVVSENRLTSIPRNFNLKSAALLGCAITTGLGIVSLDARLLMGESIVILGSGGIGQSVILGAALASAYPIIAIDHYSTRVDLARLLGASHAMTCEHTAQIRDAVRTTLDGRGADVVIETTGRKNLIELAFELAGSMGRVILVGVPRHDEDVRLHTLPLHLGKQLIGSHGGSSKPDLDIPRYVRLAQAGRLPLELLIADCFPLCEINLAIDNMRQGKVAGRCLLRLGTED